ncbi:MAG: 5'-deoxynucleotidase [Angelakisella sp.]
MSYSFFAMISRMKHIVRWGLMRNSSPENLSEHTLEVAYLVHGLTVLHNALPAAPPLDCGQAVLYALYHDCSEILTGDMPTPVKYRSPALKAAYKAVEQDAANQLLGKLPESMIAQYRPWFAPTEDYRPIVKAADRLSALIKCIQERRMGNSEFDTAYDSILAALHAMQLPEVEQFLEQFLPAYCLTLDEL